MSNGYFGVPMNEVGVNGCLMALQLKIAVDLLKARMAARKEQAGDIDAVAEARLACQASQALFDTAEIKGWIKEAPNNDALTVEEQRIVDRNSRAQVRGMMKQQAIAQEESPVVAGPGGRRM